LKKTITIHMLLNILVAAILAIPFASSYIASYLALSAFQLYSFLGQHVPNQARIAVIAQKTTNGTPILTAASRLAFTLGQSIAPVITLSLYANPNIGVSGPFIVVAGLELFSFVVHACLVPLFHDPDSASTV